MIAIERLLEAVGADDPCGPNLEYDAAFTELERIGKGRAEQQIGTTVTEAEEPNWKDVAEKGTKLLESTKDLRVAVHVAKALVKVRGYPGARDGLAILAGFLEKYWDGVHPRLDPEDDLDPTMRINVIAALADPAGYLGWLRTVPIVEARGLGAFTLRNVDLAAGEQQPAEGEVKTEQTSIDGAFRGAEIPDLIATRDAITGARERVAAIETVFGNKVGAGSGPDLSKLRALFDRASQLLAERLLERGVGVAPVNGAANGDAAVQMPNSNQIASREDVSRTIDRICEYYDRNEPTSPVPLLLLRAKRLVHMSFLDIVRDIAPDGVSQVEALRGRAEEEKS